VARRRRSRRSAAAPCSSAATSPTTRAGLVDEAAGALGGLDAFVACAVEPAQGPITALTAEAFDRAIADNARGVVLGAIAAARRMEDGRGRIVTLSSTGRT
jgi:3-oxoacyl-[acyl-carrier protein] reductase